MEPICATGVAARLRSEWDRNDGLGQNHRALKFLGQDFESLHAQCLQSGRLYEDETFPAQQSSLGFKELGPGSSKTKGVRWMRPTVREGKNITQHKQSVLTCSLKLQNIMTFGCL